MKLTEGGFSLHAGPMELASLDPSGHPNLYTCAENPRVVSGSPPVSKSLTAVTMSVPVLEDIKLFQLKPSECPACILHTSGDVCTLSPQQNQNPFLCTLFWGLFVCSRQKRLEDSHVNKPCRRADSKFPASQVSSQTSDEYHSGWRRDCRQFRGTIPRRESGGIGPFESPSLFALWTKVGWMREPHRSSPRLLRKTLNGPVLESVLHEQLQPDARGTQQN